jgi:hypothetical protein
MRRKPLFPGKSHAHQVQLVFEAMGYDSNADLGFPVSAEALSFLDKRCRYRKQPFSKLVPEASSDALDMLEALLSVNPQRRPSAAGALAFRFLSEAEILNNYNVSYLTRPTADFFDFEHEKYSVAQLRDMIDHEVFTAAANAYRNNGGISSGVTNTTSNGSVTNMEASSQQQQQHPHLSRVASNSFAHNIHQGAQDENEGPVSQLATQVKSAKINSMHVTAKAERDANSNNPFSKKDTATTTAAQSQQHVDSDVDNIAKYNILTAVRNDMIGNAGDRHPGNNLKSARKSAPKTPSPHKIDIILHKDSLNKQKALREQEESYTARSEGSYSSQRDSGEGQTGARQQPSCYSNLFARRSNSASAAAATGVASTGAGTANAIGDSNAPAAKRFSRLMSAFPSLHTGARNAVGGAGNAASTAGTSKSYRNSTYSLPSGNDQTHSNSNSNTLSARASIAMMQSGSNVIYNDHDMYSSKY